MICTVSDLRCKEIINLNSGQRLGFIYDVEVSLPEGQVRALIVPGPARFFGLFGRDEDLLIPWEKITKIGADIVLVDMESSETQRHRRDKGKRMRGFF